LTVFDEFVTTRTARSVTTRKVRDQQQQHEPAEHGGFRNFDENLTIHPDAPFGT
jgi:hypothetical protein